MAKTPEQKAAELAAKQAAEGATLSTEAIEPAEPVVFDSIQSANEEVIQAPEVIETPTQTVPLAIPQMAVPFTPEQMEIIQQLVKQTQSRGTNQPVSVYGKRDPRDITTVRVSNWEGKFVVGFKDMNNNPWKSQPKYNVMKQDAVRGFAKPEPFVTLILSSNGTDFEELTLPLVDFMDQRMKIELPVVHVDKQEVIKDHGTLGRRTDEMAVETDGNNRPVAQTNIKMESKEVVMKIYVQIPGFAHPVEFIGSDFLA